MTPFDAWITTTWGKVAVVLVLACGVCWALMEKKARSR